ncbi:MAG: protein kinase [Chlamydiota bacterium]
MMRKLIFTLLTITTLNATYAHQVGDQIQSENETYTLIKEMGEGAFGKVFEATDSQNHHYAIKCYKAKLETSSKLFDLLNDVEREYHRGQLFDHPNIIKSYDLFSGNLDSEGEQQYYLILDFVAGKTVYTTKKRTISFDQSLLAAEHLVEGLTHALRRGYLHLDLHLNNVMLDDKSDAVIIDLASFFSWNELVKYANKDSNSSKKKAIAVHADLIREKKLDAFFKQHPKILNALKKDTSLLSKSKPENDQRIEDTKLLYHPYYFDKITEAVVSIIGKSTLEKEEKLAIRAEVKKLAWSFKEDSEDGLNTSETIDQAIDELLEILNNTNN